MCWNIEGLSSRCGEPGFLNYITTFDACCFVETFTSECFDFQIHFADYFVFHSPAIKLSHHGRRSGGALILLKKNVQCAVMEIRCALDNTVVLKMCDDKGKEFIIVCIYVPPTDSPYYRSKNIKCNILLLEDELLRLQDDFPQVPILICGDFNARTGKWNIHDDSEEEEEDEDCLCSGVTLPRRSQDTSVNTFGETLINVCKVHHLCILNGSVMGDKLGRFTYLSGHGNSVIDYCLTSATFFNWFLQLQVGSQILSCHMPLEISVGPCANSRKKDHVYKKQSKLVWDVRKSEEVKRNVESAEFRAFLNDIFHMVDIDIDKAIELFADTLLSNATCMYRSVNVGSKANTVSKWFDVECKNAKQKAMDALFKYRRSKEDVYRAEYVELRNNYKQLIRITKFDYYKNSCRALLENINDSSKFWQSIRNVSNKCSERPDIPLVEWQMHFQRLLSRDSCPSMTAEKDTDVTNDELDFPIREDEVELAMAKLSSRKAPGIDEIPGDLLKLVGGQLTPFLTNLFNKLFEKQYFPQSWTQSIIIPLYKAGDKLDPQNYRGISLLSTVSKLFMSILTNRLRFWAEEENKFGFEQAAFRSDHSTIDHIFTLNAIAVKNVYGGGRGKLYAAFVDYEKAFDSVNRSCLWSVLTELGISTKFLNMLKAVYAEVCARVRWNGILTDPFDCPVGVKQGSVESPIIFCLYISYIADYVRTHGKHGVQFLPGKSEIFALLFADDIVLLSTTPTGLQRQLDSLSNVSRRLGLTVNTGKTKVMVFRRGGFLGRGERWSLDDKILEVVNSYRYLGFVFTTKLSTTTALDSLTVKAKKKVIRLQKTMWNLHTTNPRVFFRMFDMQVQPALLYGSELWGLDRQPNIEKAHLFACKRFLSVDLKSSSTMCYGELGRYPLFVNSVVRAIKYWMRLCRMPDSRLPKQALLMLSNINVPDGRNWLRSVKAKLSDLGFA